MPKLTLSDLSNLQNETTAVSTINANSALLETALENTLSRDGTSPNSMNADLDMNSNNIINLPLAASDTEPVRKAEFDEALAEIGTGTLSVNTAMLTDGSVTTDKIAAGAVTAAKLAGGITSSLITSLVSSKVTHTYSGTGGASLTLDTILNRRVISAKDYGAVGDGAADDTTALNNAITAAASGILYVPPGTYATTGELLIANPMTIMGAGMGITIIRATTLGANKSHLDITSSDVNISDLTLRGPQSGSAIASECAIAIEGTTGSHMSDIHIKNVEIFNYGQEGVRPRYVDRVSVTNCYIHDIAYAGIGFLSCRDAKACENTIHSIEPGVTGDAYGVYYSQDTLADDRCIRGTCSNNIIYDIPSWEAIDTHGGTDLTFSNNVIFDCSIGINVGHHGPSYAPERVTVTGNTMIKGTGNGIVQRGITCAGYSVGLLAKNIIVTGNNIIDYGYDAGSAIDADIFVNNSEGCVISNNLIRNSFANPILFYEENSHFVCNGNSIQGVRSGKAYAAGIRLQNAGQSGIISGNHIYSTAETGIHIANSSVDVAFYGNNISTSGTAVFGGISAGQGLELSGSVSNDFASVADGDQATTAITITGAEIGDYVDVSSSAAVTDVSLTGHVSAADTVTVMIQNNSGGAVDLASMTFYAKVTKK